MAVQTYVCTESHQFWNMHHAVFEHRFGNRTYTFGNAVERAKLRLHVGRECGIGRGGDIDRFRTAPAHIQADPINTGVNMGARFLQLC